MESNEREEPRREPVNGLKPWEPPTLIYVGNVGDVLQRGGGKLSATGGDPGEPRKERGSGR